MGYSLVLDAVCSFVQMHEARIENLLANIQSLKPQIVGEPIPTSHGPLAMTLFSTIFPPASWDPREIEQTLAVVLPSELVSLWEKTSSLRLFEDRNFGQWGLVLWSPQEILRQNPGERFDYRKEEFRAGDLLVGEFLGDLERVLLRCEHDSHDFGSVMIVAELDPRQDWFKPSRSILDFLEQFVAAEGEKFWETMTKECTKCRRGMPVTARTCPHCGVPQDLASG